MNNAKTEQLPDIFHAAILVDGLPDKDRYCISEVVPHLARVLSVSENAARIRIHRSVYDGKIEARKHAGCIRIPRSEVARILNGEDL